MSTRGNLNQKDLFIVASSHKVTQGNRVVRTWEIAMGINSGPHCSVSLLFYLGPGRLNGSSSPRVVRSYDDIMNSELLFIKIMLIHSASVTRRQLETVGLILEFQPDSRMTCYNSAIQANKAAISRSNDILSTHDILMTI